MTNKEAIVRHLVWIATDNPDRPGDKKYAWSEAKQYATLLADWSDIPAQLTARMNAAKVQMDAVREALK